MPTAGIGFSPSGDIGPQTPSRSAPGPEGAGLRIRPDIRHPAWHPAALRIFARSPVHDSAGCLFLLPA